MQRKPSQWLKDNWIELILLAILAVAVLWFFRIGRTLLTEDSAPPAAPAVVPTLVVGPDTLSFSGQRAMSFVAELQALGPRPPGSAAAADTATLIEQELRRQGWDVTIQTLERDGITLRNVVARAGPDGAALVVGAHYDTRLVADQDSDAGRRAEPVPGANGSASGVAIVLELASTLDLGLLARPVVLAFFDGGDQAGLPGWSPGVGAEEAAQTLSAATMILLDVVGAADQRFNIDPNSDRQFSEQVWSVADQLGFGKWFVAQVGPPVVGDHLPFRDQGVSVAAIAGTDYIKRHTTADTLEQVDIASLERVGRVLEAYLKSRTLPQ